MRTRAAHNPFPHSGTTFWPCCFKTAGSFFDGRHMRFQTCIAILFWLIPQFGFCQRYWEEISPVAGQQVYGLQPIIDTSDGMWITVCSLTNWECVVWGYGMRPHYSSDGGTTWELRDSGIPTEMGATVGSVAINPANPDLLLVGTRYIMGGSYPYRSTDRGLSWIAITDSFLAPPEYTSVGWFPDGQTAYLITDDHVYYLSTDSGQTWHFTYYPVDPTSRPFTTPLYPSFIAYDGNTFGAIYRSFNYGLDWEILTPDMDHIFDHIFAGTGATLDTIYASAIYYRGLSIPRVRYVFVSYDICRTWQFLNPADTLRWFEWDREDPPDYAVKDPLRSGHLFFLRADTLYETPDNGATWQIIFQKPTAQHVLDRCGYNPQRDCIYVSSLHWNSAADTSGFWRRNRGQFVEPPARSTLQSIAVSVSPNPFNSATQISFSLPVTSRVTLQLYDVLGREVKLLMDEMQTEGEHRVSFDGSDLSSGVYLCRMQAGAFMQTRKIVLLR